MLKLPTQTLYRFPTDNEELKALLSRTIRTKRQDGTEEWTTIFDRDKLERAILLYNHQHFQQAKHTPFGNGTLKSH